MKIFILIVLVLLTSCSNEDPELLAKDLVEEYFESLVARDLETQLKILEPFSLDGQAYWDSFLSYVEGGSLGAIESHYEDELLLMIKLEFTLVLNEDFPENPSFKPGENQVERYFSFFKKEDYKLKEILNKAIY